MSFSGYFIKLKGGSADEILPFSYMAADSYQAKPNQRMEAKANRATSGVLVRQTVRHTATKIEFETPPCTNVESVALNSLLQRHYTSGLERKIVLEYYDHETDTYKEGTFYAPDVTYSVNRVDLQNNIVHYNKIRLAFIEY